MRIGIDISTVLNHGNDIGAGRYIFNLIKNLFIIDRADTFVLTARYVTDEYFSLIEEIKYDYVNTAPSIAGLKNLEFKLFKTTQKKLDTWNRFGFPPIELRGFRADILHCPDFMIPPTINKNIVLTINDLAFIRFPQFNFEWFVKKYAKEVKRNAYTAKRIIAISGSTKNDIVEFFNINENKIHVTHLAADNIFRKLEPVGIDNNIPLKFGIPGKYILSVGTIEPRKNYATLIRAFNLMKSRLKHNDTANPHFDYSLVIVGRTGWKSEAAYEEYNRSPYKNNIIFVGRITDNELVQLYNQAELFVYPSIFEGFGLPVVEAMQCGLPVCASNTSSIPELVDDKKTLFNPADEEDIAAKVLIILKDDNIKKELSIKSLKNSHRFTWKKTAERTLEIYREVSGSALSR